MSDREDSQKEPSVVPPAVADAAAPIGNRPAQNARQVASQNQLDEAWRGGEDATDFLGLDLEVAPGAAQPAMVAPAQALVGEDGAGAPAQGADSEWLMSLDARRAGQAATQAAGDEASSSVATIDEFAGSEDLGEQAGIEGEEEPLVSPPLDGSWTDAEEPKRARKKRLLAIACGVLVVGAAIAVYQWKTQPGTANEEPLIAQLPNPHSAHTSTPKPDAHAATSPSSTNPSGTSHTPSPDAHTDDAIPTVADSSTKPADTTSPDADLHTTPLVADVTPPVAPGSAEPDSSAHAVEATPLSTHPASDLIESWSRAHSDASGESSGVSPLAFAPFANDALPGAVDQARNYGMSRSPSENPGAPSIGPEGTSLSLRSKFGTKIAPPPNSKLRHATESDLAGIWEGSVIPMDSIGAPSRLLTPGVGRVRVVIQRGEVFEGTLYAVGQNRVWLDTELGRLALLSDQVQRIEHLSSTGGPGLGARGSQDLAGLPRVRVRTPGGAFYGKVIARDDGMVTLITDEGARIVLETKDVENAPLGSRTVVVKPAANR